MLSLEQLRKIDPNLSDLSDEQLLSVRESLYSLSRMAFEIANKDVSKSPIGAMQSKDKEDKI